MSKEKESEKIISKRKRRPPTRTPEARENRLVNLALEMAEELLESKRAPTAVLVHFLRAGEERARLERAKIEADTKLAIAKVQIMESQKRSEELAEEALKAFRSYAGIMEEESEEYEEY